MVISVEKLREYITTDLSDDILKEKLAAIELMIRSYTHNNFQVRPIRLECPIISGKLAGVSALFRVGDTLQITESMYNNGLYIVQTITSNVEVDKILIDEGHCLVTKVEYPADVQIGVVNLMKWDLERRDKVGVSSETISRHSVTYFNMDGDNSSMGFPRSLMGFLEPYRKARF